MLRDLEARVARIEQHLHLAPSSGVASYSAAVANPHAILAETAGVVPLFGRALLGLAGAYVLRALTDSNIVPPALGVFAGILYAVFWLVWAARTPVREHAKTILYSVTAALILGPLLWEAVLRIRVLLPSIAAGVLFVFTILGLLISWRKNLLAVATIALLTSILTASALLIGSHDVVPFLVLLLAIAAAVELSACLDHWLSERWLAALAADCVVLLTTYLVTSAAGLPPSYAPIPKPLLLIAQMALPALYLSSTIVRTLRKKLSITTFETAQIALALLLAFGGALRLADTLPVRGILGVFGFGCAVLCYAAAYRLHARNFQTFSAFGLLMLLATVHLMLSASLAFAATAFLAVLFLAVADPALAWHGCFLLLASMLLSKAAVGATDLLLAPSDSEAPSVMLLGGVATAGVCYALYSRRKLPGRVLPTVLAGLTFWTVTGIASHVLTVSYHSLFGALASHAYCATFRTTLLASGAVFLAWAGRFAKSTQLAPLVYLLMILGGYRLLLLDLRQDSKAAIVFSLLTYGAALMLLPRLMQFHRPIKSQTHPGF